MDEVKIFSPATVANVSCAFDILGFALESIGDEMIFKKTAKKGLIIEMDGNSNLSTVPEENVAGVVALAMLNKVQPQFGVEMTIKKGIKPGSGIGSSAASASGAAFGMNKIFGDIFTLREMVEFAMLGEALASGVQHADNVAPALYGGFTLIRSLDPLDIVTIPAPKKLVCKHPASSNRSQDNICQEDFEEICLNERCCNTMGKHCRVDQWVVQRRLCADWAFS